MGVVYNLAAASSGEPAPSAEGTDSSTGICLNAIAAVVSLLCRVNNVCKETTQRGSAPVYRPAGVGAHGGSGQTGPEDPGPTTEPDQRGQDVGSIWSGSATGSHHNSTNAPNGGTTDTLVCRSLANLKT